MPSTPLVSVCIPTYKGAAHLAAAIESVLRQSLYDLELVVVDDASPDNTRQVVQGYKDPRIRYLCNTRNLGPEGNWNRCWEEIRGRYFKLLPQDDLLYPDTLRRQVEVLEMDTEQRLALVFGSRIIIDAQGCDLMKRCYPGGQEGIVSGEQLIRRCVRYGTNLIGEPGSVLMRTSLARIVGPFDGSIPYIIDLDYWVRLLKHGDAYYIPDPVAAFRVSAGSWSVAIGSKQSNDYRRFIDKLNLDPQLCISRLDRVSGHVMAKANSLARLLFYFYVLK